MTAATRQEQLAAIFKSATVIPVLTIERLEDAVPLARALVAGGVRVLEVTLRTPVAADAAKAMIAEVPEAIVGIGTILNADDLARAVALGAKFGISPGATPELLKAAAASDLPFAPGIATASELMQALAAGFDLVKFFPGRAGRRYQGTSGAGRAVSEYQGMPDRRHWRGQCRVLAGRAECGGGGRFLALPGGRYPVRQLGRHNRHVRAGDEIAESRHQDRLQTDPNRNRENDHDSQHRRMGAHAIRQVRRGNRREPRGEGCDRSAGRCRHIRRRRRRDRARAFQCRLLAAGFYGLAGAAGRPQTALQAGYAGRERLRHRFGGGASGHPGDCCRRGQDRAGGRRRADDADAGPGDRTVPAEGLLSARGRRHRRRLCRRVRQDRAELFPEIWRPVGRAGDDRGQEPQERRRQPLCADAQGFWLRVLPRREREEPVTSRAP